MKTNKRWKPCQFNRDEYLEHADLYEAVKIDDATSELCEFNDDAEDLAIELAYMRHRLAKTEVDLRKLVERMEDLTTDPSCVCEWCMATRTWKNEFKKLLEDE